MINVFFVCQMSSLLAVTIAQVDTFQIFCGTPEQICENGRVCKDTRREDMMTCKCNFGFRYSSGSRRCEAAETPTPFDCTNLENQCAHGRPCLNSSRTDRPMKCKCDDGFEFSSTTRKCEAKSNAVETECVAIENVCENGKLCTDINRDGVVTCKCDSGYNYNRQKRTCEEVTIPTDCVDLVNPCRNGQICRDDSNSGLFRCECKDGFLYNPFTGNCEDNIECKKREKECPQDDCENDYDSFHCYCHKGYTLVTDEEITLTSSAMCPDINECSEVGHVCSEGECMIIDGEIICTCDNENTLEGSALCGDGDECDSKKNLCPDGKCKHTIGSYICRCLPGFELNANGYCTDINECNGTKKPCLNAECINTHGSYSCQCFEGFSLTADGKCEDINECNDTGRPCQNAECINTAGSYSCQCFEGFQLTLGGICRAIPTTKPTTPTTPRDEDSSVTASKLPSSEPSVLDKYQSESSEIPLPAIVVPVILIIVGVGLLGVFLWRKRCRGNKKADQAKAYYENNQIMITNGSHIKHLQDRDSTGAADENDPENTYTTIEIIDTADVFQHTQTKNNSLKDKVNKMSQIDKRDYLILEVQDAHASINNDSASCIINRICNKEAVYLTHKNDDTVHKDTHDYCVLEPEYTHLSSDPSKDSSKPHTGQTDVQRKQTVQSGEPGDSESNTYFILEPCSAGALRNGNECIDEPNLKLSNTNDLHSQASSLEKYNHDYFVLESEGRNSSYVSPDQSVIGKTSTCDCQETSDDNYIDTDGNHDYFILEPQTKVPCPDSKVSRIQTLPDDEYNVLNLKLKGPNQDNFTASKSRDLVVDTERNISEANPREYSHVKFKDTASEDEHQLNV